MNNYYNTNKYEKYPYEISSSKKNQENSEENDDNFIYENPYQKYLMEKNNRIQNGLEMNTSQEEINSKEDIIEIKNEDEIMPSDRGKFRFVNAQAGQKDKIERFQTQNNANPNKITNNICIIINKPEVKGTDNIENNSNNIEFIDTFGKEFNINNSNNKNNNIEHNQHKKNNSYVLNKKNKKSEIEPPEEYDNYNYSYIETEPNEKNKITLHKKLKQKKQKLKDLEQTIQNKQKSLKEKKSKIDMKESKRHKRSTTFDSGKKSINKKRNDKEESITYESSDNKSSRKKKILNIKNKNSNNNTENKSINSEDKIFNDIPMIKIEKNKYFEEENVYKTVSMSPDISRDKYNISFNKSIEQKRRLLGIPLYQNEFQKYNKNKLNKSKNNNRVEMYKKRQEEILNNYEKKNIINQKSREMLKKNKKTKTPIRINYNDNYNKTRNLNENTNFDINDNKNKKGNSDEKQKNINVNHSFVISQKPYIKNKNKNKRSQNEIEVYSKNNKTQNNTKSNNNKEQVHNYFKKKIKVYKQKEKSKENKNIKIKDNRDDRKSKEKIEYKLLPGKNEIPKEKKVYENNTYYSKIISKMLNFNENESQKNSGNKETKNNSDNKNNSNTKKNNNLNTNNYKDVSTFNSKNIFSSPKQNEIMTIQNNEGGKTLRIVKRRHKSPKKSEPSQKNNQYQYQNKNQIAISENNKPKKEEKKEYKNNVVLLPSRGISTLRRINQKIENYKKRVPSRKRRRTKNKNQQYKSLSHLKKIGKFPVGRVKQSKSIKTLPDINKDAYHNFDFIDDL